MKLHLSVRLSFILFCLSFGGVSLSADCTNPLSEEQKIEALIQSVKGLDGVFIRNGSEHNAKEASDHLRMKLDSAKKSFFAPKEKDWTAQLFIEKVASKSSLSGDPYQIKTKDGKTILAQVWLKKELDKINLRCN
ncbi:DUF5329 family protein [Leptospira idonii]|uniref:Uncharacterized protein n=1 Tax=Leptospira idonii TaxID=1193500 RepID=A0A4R9LWD9_9LEPT|nr:DUF5329 family protein [Leptospira idonii]TGN17267.1 hypothetical protein EHS15_17150 [Leptospira idonii]